MPASSDPDTLSLLRLLHHGSADRTSLLAAYGDSPGRPVAAARALVDIAVVSDWLGDGGQLAAVLSPAELDELEPRSDRAPGVAGRLAAKLAVARAWTAADGTGDEGDDPVLWARAGLVEVVRSPGGAPVARVATGPDGPAPPAEVHVSLSHDGGLAVALAVVVGGPGPPGSPNTPRADD